MIKEISRNDVIPFMRMASKFTPQSLPLHIKNGGKVGRQYAHSVKVVYESL